MNALLLGAAIAIGAPALRDKQAADIAGEWVVEDIQSTGKAKPVVQGEMRYIFTADGRWFVYQGEKRSGGDAHGYSVDSQKRPATIDMIADVTDKESPVFRGIYKIEGTKLTLMLGRANRPRPTAFALDKETPGTLYVMKRVPAKE